MKELQAIVRALTADPARPSVLATLATVEGSSYRRPDARLQRPTGRFHRDAHAFTFAGARE